MQEGGSDGGEKEQPGEDPPTPEDGAERPKSTEQKHNEDTEKVPGSPAPTSHEEDIFGDNGPVTGKDGVEPGSNMELDDDDYSEEEDEDFAPEEDGATGDEYSSDGSEDESEMDLDEDPIAEKDGAKGDEYSSDDGKEVTAWVYGSAGDGGGQDTDSDARMVLQARDPPGLQGNEQL